MPSVFQRARSDVIADGSADGASAAKNAMSPTTVRLRGSEENPIRFKSATSVGVIASAGAPVVCETPGDAAGQGADISWLRERLPA